MKPVSTGVLALVLFVLGCAGPAAAPELQGWEQVADLSRPEAVVDWTRAGEFLGRTVTVTGTVVRTHNTGKVVFLNFTEDWKGTFSVAIFASSWADFPQPPEELFDGREVRVTGRVKEYRGAPEIVVDSPQQVVWSDGKPVSEAARLVPIPEPGPRAAGLRVVSWNIENFFDRFDDPYTRDELTDPATVSKERKRRVAAALLRLNADVVCLQEVENRFILRDLNQAYLAPLGYEVVHFEGNDSRGIDVALLTRLPVESVTSYRHLRFPDAAGGERQFQRDLLRVRLGGALAGDVYVVHLKSQGGGEDADRIREAEARAAMAILGAELERDPGYRAVVAGDFNDVADQPTLRAFLDGGLVDPHAGSAQHTYNREPYLTRIDYTLCTPALAQALQAGSARVVTEAPGLKSLDLRRASDHFPVVVEFAPPSGAAGGR